MAGTVTARVAAVSSRLNLFWNKEKTGILTCLREGTGATDDRHPILWLLYTNVNSAGHPPMLDGLLEGRRTMKGRGDVVGG